MPLSRTNVGSTNTPGQIATGSLTTASFTPANNSLLIIVAHFQSSLATFTPTITDNLGSHLTYTKQVQVGPDSLNKHFSVLYTAPVTTGALMTVTVGGGPSDGTFEGVIHVYTYTGYNTSAPVGGTAVLNNALFGSAVNLTLSSAPATTSEVLGCAQDDTGGGAANINVGTGWTTQLTGSDTANIFTLDETRTSSTSTNVLWNANTTPGGNQGVALAVEIVAAAAGVVERLTEFKSRTFPVKWNLNAALFRTSAQATSSFGVETNPHWVGKPQPPQWNISKGLYRNPATDVPFVVTDTPVYFIQRPYPVQWSVNKALWQITAQDFSSFGVETNPHWLGKPWPPAWNLTLRQNPSTDVPISVVETNPHWMGKPWPLLWSPQSLLQNPAVDVPTTVIETNPPWVGKTYPTQWNTLRTLWQNTPTDVFAPAVETNIHFAPRTMLMPWNTLDALWQTSAQDFSTVVPPPTDVQHLWGFSVIRRPL